MKKTGRKNGRKNHQKRSAIFIFGRFYYFFRGLVIFILAGFLILCERTLLRIWSDSVWKSKACSDSQISQGDADGSRVSFFRIIFFGSDFHFVFHWIHYVAINQCWTCIEASVSLCHAFFIFC